MRRERPDEAARLVEALMQPGETASPVASLRPSWTSRAACRDVPGVDFFDDAAPEAALAVCAGCPVRAECLDWAVSTGATHGVFGGRTAAQRRPPPRPPDLCVVCGAPAVRRQRCGPCFLYVRRHGHERPAELVREAERAEVRWW